MWGGLGYGKTVARAINPARPPSRGTS
jgi:hypothetical protein